MLGGVIKVERRKGERRRQINKGKKKDTFTGR